MNKSLKCKESIKIPGERMVRSEPAPLRPARVSNFSCACKRLCLDYNNSGQLNICLAFQELSPEPRDIKGRCGSVGKSKGDRTVAGSHAVASTWVSMIKQAKRPMVNYRFCSIPKRAAGAVGARYSTPDKAILLFGRNSLCFRIPEFGYTCERLFLMVQYCMVSAAAYTTKQAYMPYINTFMSITYMVYMLLFIVYLTLISYSITTL